MCKLNGKDLGGNLKLSMHKRDIEVTRPTRESNVHDTLVEVAITDYVLILKGLE